MLFPFIWIKELFIYLLCLLLWIYIWSFNVFQLNSKNSTKL